MYIPLPEKPSPSTGNVINHIGNKALKIMTSLFVQPVHVPQYEYTNSNLHRRTQKLTSDKKDDGNKAWILAIPFGIMILLAVLASCAEECRQRRERERDARVGERRNGTQRPFSRSRTNDPRTERRLYSSSSSSNVLPRPTGQMGAARVALSADIPVYVPTLRPQPGMGLARAALGATIEPEVRRTTSGIGVPTGQMGAARAALGATIEPQRSATANDARLGVINTSGPRQWNSSVVISQRERARRNSDSSISFQRTIISSGNETRVISHPIHPPNSVYALRRGENPAQMMQRVNDELHRTVSNFPIFQNSVPKPPDSLPIRRPGYGSSVDEQVRRQVAAFPIFQRHGNESEIVQSRVEERNSAELTRPATTPGMRMDEELRRDVAAAPLFQGQGPANYRSMPTRRPGNVTPPPAYEYAPGYVHARDDNVSEMRVDMGEGYGGNDGNIPSSPPPAYFQGDRDSVISLD